jgi:hypothetical protein
MPLYLLLLSCHLRITLYRLAPAEIAVPCTTVTGGSCCCTALCRDVWCYALMPLCPILTRGGCWPWGCSHSVVRVQCSFLQHGSHSHRCIL